MTRYWTPVYVSITRPENAFSGASPKAPFTPIAWTDLLAYVYALAEGKGHMVEVPGEADIPKGMDPGPAAWGPPLLFIAQLGMGCLCRIGLVD